MLCFCLTSWIYFFKWEKKGGAYGRRNREEKESPEMDVDNVVVFPLWQIFCFLQGVLRKDKRHKSCHSLCAMRLTSMILQKYLEVQSEDSLTCIANYQANQGYTVRKKNSVNHHPTVLGIKPKSLNVLLKCSITELHT